MIPDRAWVLLPSGRRLDLLTPDPAAWTNRDLAIGLSRTYRWGGHSRWDLPLSVAQHSLLVLVLRQQMQALQPLTQGEALRELLHDAEEGLIGFDAISPLKPHLGSGFKAVNDRLRVATNAINSMPGMPPTTCGTRRRTTSPPRPRRSTARVGRARKSARACKSRSSPLTKTHCRCRKACNPGSRGHPVSRPRYSSRSCRN